MSFIVYLHFMDFILNYYTYLIYSLSLIIQVIKTQKAHIHDKKLIVTTELL